MEYIDPIAANELMTKMKSINDTLDRHYKRINRLIKLEKLVNNKLFELREIKRPYYLNDGRLVHDLNNNFLKYVFSDKFGVYSYCNFVKPVNQFNCGNEFNQYLYKLFEESF